MPPAAQPRRRAALFAASAAVASLLLVSRASGAAFAAAAPMTAVSYLSALFMSLTPGLLVAGGASVLYARRERPPKPAWCVAAALLALLTLAIPLWVTTGDLQQPAQKPEQAAQAAPRSGEERLMPDGSFMRVSDPRPGNGPIEAGWQQALWTEMTEAITKGEEQVVMVFSRQGCPWCDRLHPVLQNAIKKRAAAIADGAMEGPPLLNSPLRIFVYDLQEFGPIMQRFQIEGFPTILAFGPTGSRPVMVPGYLSDEDFEKLLTEVAVAKPDAPKRKKKLFR